MTNKYSIKLLVPVLFLLAAVLAFVATQNPQTVAADDANGSQNDAIVQTAVSQDVQDAEDEDVIPLDDTYPDPFQAAADAVGVSLDALWEAIDNGQTIAEIAAENGVELQTVIDAMVAAEYEFIDQLLADGEIDEAEAEEWRSEVVEYTTDMVNEGFDDLMFDEDFVDPLDGAAETIGVEIDAFWDGLDNGQTIAEIASENGVALQTVIDAMVAAEYEFIDQLLADGEIDEAEAEEWRSEVVEYTTEMVNEGFDAFLFDEDFVDPLDVAAETIGVEIDAFWDGLDNGQTIAEIAAENGVALQTVIDAMVAAEYTVIDDLLANGEIDEAEAEEWRSDVVAYTTETVNESWDWYEDGVELFFDEACVIEANGASLNQLDIPESCLDGFAVFGATAVP